MKLTPSFAFLGTALLATALPATAFELHHSDGTLKLDTTPENVVSFDLGVLDTLATLDVPVAGVPRSVYEGVLARYRTAPVIGTLFEPDYAELGRIRPDLIIG